MFSCWEGVASCVIVQVLDQSNLVTTVLDKLRFINQYTTGLYKLSFDSETERVLMLILVGSQFTIKSED